VFCGSKGSHLTKELHTYGLTFGAPVGMRTGRSAVAVLVDQLTPLSLGTQVMRRVARRVTIGITCTVVHADVASRTQYQSTLGYRTKNG
jgi:hypothetical protein